MSAPVKSAVPIGPAAVMARVRALILASGATQLRRNTVAGGLGAIVGGLISAMSYPVYLYFLGYEQYGLWLAVSVVLSVAAYGQLGLAPAVATTVAERHARGDIEGVRTTVSTALISLSAVGVVAVTVILLCGGAFISSMHLRPKLEMQAQTLLPFTALLSLYVVQIETINAVLVGLGRLDLAVGTVQVGRLLSLVVAVTLLVYGLGVVSLPIAYLTGNVFVHVASLTLARKAIREGCFRFTAFQFTHLRTLASFGSGLLVCSLINVLLGPLNKYTLTRYVGPSSVTVYDMAFTLTMHIRGVLESGFRSVMPEVSRLKTLPPEEAHLRVGAVYRRSMQLIVGVGLPVFGAAIVVAHVMLELWLGARFRPQLVPALRVLLLGGGASLLGVPGYYMLLGLRGVKQIVAATSVQASVNAAALGCICWAGHLSALSTAAAASAGFAAGGIYMAFATRTAGGGFSGVAHAHNAKIPQNVSAQCL